MFKTTFFKINSSSVSKPSSNNIFGHPFHIVNNSPWPILVSLAVFSFTSTFVICVHCLARPFGVLFFLLSVIFLSFLSFFWWSDVIDESLDGYHTPEVATGLRLGFVLFIVSEVMFFFSFFWAFFLRKFGPFYLDWLCMASIWYYTY